MSRLLLLRKIKGLFGLSPASSPIRFHRGDGPEVFHPTASEERPTPQTSLPLAAVSFPSCFQNVVVVIPIILSGTCCRWCFRKSINYQEAILVHYSRRRQRHPHQRIQDPYGFQDRAPRDDRFTSIRSKARESADTRGYLGDQEG